MLEIVNFNFFPQCKVLFFLDTSNTCTIKVAVDKRFNTSMQKSFNSYILKYLHC